MNRPFGAGTLLLAFFREIDENAPTWPIVKADIYANLKGAVAKTAVQKTLIILAEKDAITQKAYGKCIYAYKSVLSSQHLTYQRESPYIRRETSLQMFKSDNKHTDRLS